MDQNSKRRPWWAVALMGGFGAVLAVLFSLGFIGKGARGEPQLATATVAAQSVEEQQRWRERVEKKLDDLTEKVARIEGRLDKR